MARHIGPVLIDTNVILECYRAGSWPALAGGYRVETVEDCVAETQTGFQRRRPERRIDEGKLRELLAEVHSVGDRERAELLVRAKGIALDAGETSLWAHALSRNDAWVLCGPDKASLRLGVRLEFRERLVSLERLLNDIGARPKSALRLAYTGQWHKRALAEIVLAERGSCGGRLPRLYRFGGEGVPPLSRTGCPRSQGGS